MQFEVHGGVVIVDGCNLRMHGATICTLPRVLEICDITSQNGTYLIKTTIGTYYSTPHGKLWYLDPDYFFTCAYVGNCILGINRQCNVITTAELPDFTLRQQRKYAENPAADPPALAIGRGAIITVDWWGSNLRVCIHAATESADYHISLPQFVQLGHLLTPDALMLYFGNAREIRVLNAASAELTSFPCGDVNACEIGDLTAKCGDVNACEIGDLTAKCCINGREFTAPRDLQKPIIWSEKRQITQAPCVIM